MALMRLIAADTSSGLSLVPILNTCILLSS
jgi:hypothetical protein